MFLVTIEYSEGMNERSQPSILSDIIGYLPENSTHVSNEPEFTNEEGTWVRLLGGGYVATVYNGSRKASVVEIVPNGNSLFLVTTENFSGMNKRDAPSISSRITGYLQPKSFYFSYDGEFTNEEGNWVRLSDGGFVASVYNDQRKLSVIEINPDEFKLGLSDYMTNDPLGSPYCDNGFFPRNWTPPKMRPSVPEVRRQKNKGTAKRMFFSEGIEWVVYSLLKIRNPYWSEDTLRLYFRKHLRGDAGYTNKAGTDERKSFVLGTNMKKEPMELMWIYCPGGNLFRRTDGDSATFDGRKYNPIWVLDYDWMYKNVKKADALSFARSLPAWLVNTAKIVHPTKIGEATPNFPNGIFRVTDWDGRMTFPNMSSYGRIKTVDGFVCREVYMQENRMGDIIKYI